MVEQTEEDKVRIIYPFRAKFFWFASSSIVPVYFLLMLAFFVMSWIWWPSGWRIIPGLMSIAQLIGFIFVVRDAFIHYGQFRAAFNAMNDMFEDGVREPGDDRPYSRYQTERN